MRVRLLVLDVDGVLTDGTFVLHGEAGEWKAFHSADGLGLRLLMDAGIKVAFLTGRESDVVERRRRELGVDEVVSGRTDKQAALEELCGRLGIEMADTAYMGDDLVDVPAMRAAGYAAAPADARPEALEVSDYIAPCRGGRGAVRDLCEHILREAGLWEQVRSRFLACDRCSSS